ncbi:hypothetical protein STEG23_005441 [Scotinomys teguina]
MWSILEKVPWDAKKKQKERPCFHIHSANLCLFIGDWLFLGPLPLSMTGCSWVLGSDSSFKGGKKCNVCYHESGPKPIHGTPSRVGHTPFEMLKSGIYLKGSGFLKI